MSFSGNPLGPGTRLDHNSFMNHNQHQPESPPEDSISSSPPRRSVVPLSYAYGAPTLGKPLVTQTSPNRVPSPTRSSSSSVRNRSARSAINNAVENEEDIDSNISHASSSTRVQEPGTVRYARLKQRNQALGTSSYHPSGPGIILSPPNGTSLRDTSVNVATAFNQAAHGVMSSAPGRSHDYEKETHTSTTTTNRRIAAPPSKSRKPNSTNSTRLAPPDEVADRKARAKSPILETMASAGQAIARAISPTTYYLRDPIEEAQYQPLRMDDSQAKPLSRQGTKTSTVPSNESYDYEAEENYMRGESSGGANRSVGHQKKKSATMTAAARLSMDNKAYKPPSDDEEEEEDYEEDGVRRKRKGKKKDEGKALTTLPTIGYDKRKKKKSISKRSGATMDEDDSVSAGEQASLPVDDQRPGSRPPSRPPSRAGSVTRDQVPPSHPAHFQPPQPSIEEVPEAEEEVSGPDPNLGYDSDVRPLPRGRSKDRPPVLQGQASEKRRSVPPRTTQSNKDAHRLEAQIPGRSSGFSIGAFLGKIIHLVLTMLRLGVQFIAMIFFLFWTVIGGIFNVLVIVPLYWVGATTQTARRDLPCASIGKVVFFALIVAMVAAILRPSTLAGSSWSDNLWRWVPGRSSFTYRAPDIPAESVQDLIARLTHIENALAGFTFREQQAQKAHSIEQRVHGEVATRVELLHGRIEAEAQRALEAEEQFRAAAAKGLTAIRSEFEALQSEWERARGEGITGSATLEDLRELQERVGNVEDDTKEALEVAKSSVKTGNTIGWWNKWSGVGENKLTIKSSDGQDVTGLISSLVDHAVSRFSKDILGKPDFALYSAGGRVIPHLTSNTYEIKPNTWARYVIGAVTGSGYTMGHPPVTAIHPDIHVGNCWPFAGTQGQIGLLLARNVFISEFSIDHAPRDVAYDVRAAPRQMEVWGLVQGADNIAKVREYQQTVRQRREEVIQRAQEQGVPPPPEEDPYPASLPRSPHYIRLSQFTYDIHSPEYVQTFPVPKDIQEIGADFGVVVLLIKNNWGEEDFTCLYRLRVHGTDKDRRPYLLPEQDTP